MAPKSKSQSWSALKQSGNDCFKTGQYGEATIFYSQAIKELEKAAQKNPEDLGILYSNRAASYLKDGNCSECVKDCTTSLELYPFNVKSLLRRASAYEGLERYRLAYVDYKTALQVDCNIAAAHDGTNRMTKALTEIDGPSWREKLPPIPTVPMSVRERLNQQPASPQLSNNKTNTPGPGPSEKDRKKALTLKDEGNALVKKGEYRKAIDKYSQSIQLNPNEITTYTNRALCFLSLKQHREAVKDCDQAINMDSANIKALYRRAQAHRELQNPKSCIDDLNSLLKIEPKNGAALKLLQDVQKK
ncbi:mitochondrial import receptor subunit TOM34 [Eucyclogobius newberryi]|uniref:mitochondrial import receptor subunit TOM34 n=1 Tax=Eucyclogobius newberryi TaxID=166745 RepID=UPI003B5CAFBB